MTPWGFHLILDVSRCEIPLIDSRDNILKFIKELVIAIDMEAYGEPLIEKFALHDADKSGFSFVQLIQTSNITGHFVSANGSAYIDVFSCKPYSYDVVVAMVKHSFKPEKITQQIILREA